MCRLISCPAAWGDTSISASAANAGRSPAIRPAVVHAAARSRFRRFICHAILAQVRHETGREWAKPFRISSGNSRVYTTFSIEFEAFGEADVELLKEGSLVGFGLGDTAETKLAAVGGGKDAVGALQGGQQGDVFHRRQWRGIIDTAGGFFRNHRWPAF